VFARDMASSGILARDAKVFTVHIGVDASQVRVIELAEGAHQSLQERIHKYSHCRFDRRNIQ
jgi:hypothetical protein